MAALSLAGLGSPAVAATPSDSAPADWAMHAQLQLPVLAANHAVGGLGLGVGIEKDLVAVLAEAQMYPIEVCDDACGTAYGAGVGVALQPKLIAGVDTRFGLVVQYFAPSDLRQGMAAVGPRVGVRWPQAGTALSLDAGIAFASSSNFASDGFAKNKLIGWGMPQLMLGIWL